MFEQRFYHEVLGPFFRFKLRAAQNVCVAPDFSDVKSLAIAAATAAYHFHEVVSREKGTQYVPKMQNIDDELARQQLSDAVDTAKHGILKKSNSHRQCSFSAGISFEFNEKNEFRFLETEIVATNQRFGSFELATSVEKFIKALMQEHDIKIEFEYSLPSHPFTEFADTYLTSDSGFDIKQTNLRFYRRDSNNQLILADPENVTFRVLEKLAPIAARPA